MPSIDVRLPALRHRSYTITIAPGALASLPALVADGGAKRRRYLITDATVNRLWGRKVARALEAQGTPAVVLEIPAGEQSKNALLAGELQTALLTSGVQRDSLVIALGGGVIGDLAGYVAATVLRGIPFVQVPTTLLSQVDSSVGGKVGIDHEVGKNLLGAFHQPMAVCIDPEVLATLPERQFRSGLAEVVKIAAALDRPFFQMIRSHARAIRKSNVKLLTTLIARSVALKAAVVEKDEFESGLRKSLNLGHTIGHAVEAATGFAVTHGEAVSIGMAAEAGIAHVLGLVSERELQVLISTLRGLKLPVAMPRIKDRQKFLRALAADKKSAGGTPRFALPAGIGATAIGVEVPPLLIERVLEQGR